MMGKSGHPNRQSATATPADFIGSDADSEGGKKRREEEGENARSIRGRNINVTAEGSCDEIREVKARHG